jgi:putative tryptophan/tyrosine transport system substrate-binding protein
MKLTTFVRIGIAVAALACIEFSSSASSRPWKPTPSQIAADYGSIGHNKGNGNLVTIVWHASPTATPGSQLVSILEKYVLISVTHSQTELGEAAPGLHFDDIDKLEVRDDSGSLLAPIDQDTLPPTSIGVLATFEAGYRQGLGPRGKGTKFFLFDAGAGHACEKGAISVPYDAETYTWETPFPGCSAKAFGQQQRADGLHVGETDAIPVIGYLDPGGPQLGNNFLAAFRRGMSETGLVVGQNVTLDYRYAHHEYDRLLNAAADLVRRRVTVIFANGQPAIIAAKAATATIPIVFITGADPVEFGFETSFNRPTSNLTGVAYQSAEVTAKRFTLLHELAPTAETIAFLAGGYGSFNQAETRDLENAARAVGVNLLVLHASTASEIEKVFSTPIEYGALLISSSFEVQRYAQQIISLSARHAIPTMFASSGYTSAGGLSSYGSRVADAEYQVGLYIGRILKGQKPTQLPIVQPTKFEFVINLQTAKKIGLTVPPRVLALADRFIE